MEELDNFCMVKVLIGKEEKEIIKAPSTYLKHVLNNTDIKDGLQDLASEISKTLKTIVKVQLQSKAYKVNDYITIATAETKNFSILK
jgi:sugar-specific transcriptional regulator TrmB